MTTRNSTIVATPITITPAQLNDSITKHAYFIATLGKLSGMSLADIQTLVANAINTKYPTV